MATKMEADLIREISAKYGSVINLEETPAVLTEVLRVYGSRFPARERPEGSGGVMSGTIAGGDGGTVGGGDGGVNPPPKSVPTLSEIMRGILHLRREVRALHKKVDRLASSRPRTELPRRPPRSKVKSRIKKSAKPKR